MAREIVIPKFGDTNVFKITDKKEKEPGEYELAINVKAIGINFADISMRMGLYKDAPPLPFSPGYEVSGIVSKVGNKVKNFKNGDRVFAATYFGGYTDYVCVHQDKVRLIPENISFNEAAAILVNYITAYIALNEMSRIRNGDHVLIHGAAGGVGLAAIQIAKEKNCIIYGTAGSKEKIQFISDFGVQHPISYREEDFVSAIKKINGGKLDAILDPVGGENLHKNMSLLKASGNVVVFGASSMISGEKRNIFQVVKQLLAMRKIDTLKLIDSNIGVFGLNALKMWDDPLLMNGVDVIVDKFKNGIYKIHVSETFPFEKAGEAHKYIQERKNIGKVVLTV